MLPHTDHTAVFYHNTSIVSCRMQNRNWADNTRHFQEGDDTKDWEGEEKEEEKEVVELELGCRIHPVAGDDDESILVLGSIALVM